MTAPLEQVAGYGVVGALLIVALLALRYLHHELAAERAARIQDAKDFGTLLLQIQREVLVAVDRLSDLYTMVQNERLEERARREHR